MATRLTSLLFAVFAVLAFSRSATLSAQTMIQIGYDTLLNNAFLYPSPYSNMLPGGRMQLLFHADELQAEGMDAGTISAIGFDVYEPTGATHRSLPSIACW